MYAYTHVCTHIYECICMNVCIFPRKKKGITGMKINMQCELSAIQWAANNRGYYIRLLLYIIKSAAMI